MQGFRVIAAVVALAGLANPADSQTFEEVFSAAQGAVGDIAKYQRALQNPDQRLQYSLVQQMLRLPDPALQRIAKEHALFSTNPVMREAAIKAILDSGATLRFQIAGDRASAENITSWASVNGGTFSDTQGLILVKVPPPVTDACWGNEKHCIFRQVGTTVQFNPYYPGNYTMRLTSVMQLGNDGVLRGNMSHSNKEFVQVQVDLKE